MTCLTLLLLTLQACSTDSGSDHPFTKGNGTEENPFWISDIHQLQAIGDTLYLDSHFIQVRDIDASESADFRNGLGFNEIGNAEHPFTGSYNGGGFVIRDLHLHINVEDKTNGLFGYLKNATLKNITIDNSNQLNQKSLTSRQSRLQKQQTVSLQQIIGSGISENQGNGGLAGINDEGVVLNCHFTGALRGELSQSIAGLVGVNSGIIEESSFEGYVSAGSANGLVSWNVGEIRSSRVSADLSGQSGYGFVGVNEGIITRSSTNVEIFAGNGGSGFVGTNSTGRIESSFATGRLSSWLLSAGFVTTNRGTILDSYSHVTIELTFDDSNPEFNSVGGFVAYNQAEGRIETSFTASAVTLDPPDGTFLKGGAAAENVGEIRSTYWDREAISLEQAIGEGSGEGFTGLTTTQMTGPAAQENMPEFDWVNTWTTTPDGYPILRWQDQ